MAFVIGFTALVVVVGAILIIINLKAAALDEEDAQQQAASPILLPPGSQSDQPGAPDDGENPRRAPDLSTHGELGDGVLNQKS
ncbi:hypothetical protein GCM10025857_01000 [Alicyclobacillus contaminans]|uniref:hypothetical protein n=1 Tax=Alicyclobacillus contaminans TaxID=392016 RepID=UPI00047D338C|nr:hypothetical protein [Alicyclobacillus contaminans]GMA48743.1 hypothetical protein GCM10025857_01000 [Alicyclobacillus contaminans]